MISCVLSSGYRAAALNEEYVSTVFIGHIYRVVFQWFFVCGIAYLIYVKLLIVLYTCDVALLGRSLYQTTH